MPSWDPARKSAWYMRNRKRLIEKAREYNTGVTPEQYASALASQGGLCKVCHGPQVSRYESFCADHCHMSGRFCGLLCSNCNIAIGLLREDPCIAQRAAEYILENK